MTKTFTGPLYSQQAAPELAAQIVRIPPGSDTLELFATDFMGDLRQGDAPACVRLEAVLNPVQRTWRIDRLTRLSGEEGGITNHATELGDGLCFFDALHYCARFQASAEASGQLPVPVTGVRWISALHYKTVAEDAGQIIDKDGEAHPCAQGTTLGKGFFSDKEYEIAAKTKGMTPVEKIVVSGNAGLVTLKQNSQSIAVASQTDMIDGAVNKIKLIGQIKDVLRAGGEFSQAFRDAADLNMISEFQSPDSHTKLGAYYISTITLGLPFLMARDKIFVEQSVRKRLDKFVKAASILPESLEKALCMEFAKTAAYAIPMEKAAQIFGLCRNQKKSKAFLQKGLSSIEAAGTVANLGRPEIEQIKANYLLGQFKPRAFLGLVQSAWGEEEFMPNLKRWMALYMEKEVKKDPEAEKCLSHKLRVYITRLEAG